MIEIIKGDLLEAPQKYIAHQCNAVSNQAGGLAHYMFKKFPYSDIYSARSYPYKVNPGNSPGNIFVMGNGKDKRFVINMIAQYYPGSPKVHNSIIDGFRMREGYFRRCLLNIEVIPNLESIAFPYQIGCGLAGGSWDNYLEILKDFETRVKQKQDAKVFIYNNEELA
jgi:O-acetyl-ADP-ribose deacetylase (regulator of RNase III)